MKRFFPKLVMTVAMLLSFLPVSAYDFVANGIFFNITDATNHEVEVTNNDAVDTYAGDISIPSTVTNGGTTYTVTYIGDRAFCMCSGLTSVTIPNSVTAIENEAFLSCTRLTSITIPNSVTYIGVDAFRGCSGLTSIVIPNSVTYIGKGAFEFCENLTSIIIPNSVTYIGDWIFSWCNNLTSVSIPNSVTSIGEYAFHNCGNLTSIIIPNSVTSIGKGAFSFCGSLTSINIPNSVTYIGDNAFDTCWELIDITIPKSVTYIGGLAFFNCGHLTNITIPNSVTYIGVDAFSGCPLKSVYCNWQEPLKFSYNLFSSDCYVDGTLYVPKGCADKYNVTFPWSNFRNIEEADYLGVEDIIADQSTGEYVVYDLQGVLRLKTENIDEVNQLPAGLYIINGKKVLIR